MSDSDNTPFGFGRFVPGFDFLQNLAKSATSGVSAMPGLANWVAPTVSVEELDKRIGELKSVQFWLEQNSRALAATVQALEVQKMTLATLENMNVAMGDIAGAFGAGMSQGAQTKKAGSGAAAPSPAPAPAPASRPEDDTAGAAKARGKAQSADSGAKPSAQAGAFMPGAGGMVDPVQWWTSLTHQFQDIAANAMRDVSQHAANAPASVAGNDAFRQASDMAAQFAAQSMEGMQEMTRSAMAAAGGKAKKEPAPKAAAPARKAPAKKTSTPRKPGTSSSRSSK
ncbi:MAG: hypothetical protein LBE61_12045 [Burkholderiaceae bacterium]|jgi:hypothetical protein|nr:hypothetical protein [Burkholderiaceae bacterium]